MRVIGYTRVGQAQPGAAAQLEPMAGEGSDTASAGEAASGAISQKFFVRGVQSQEQPAEHAGVYSFDLALQEHRIRSYATARQWLIERIIAEENIPGTTPPQDRPSLQQLLGVIERHDPAKGPLAIVATRLDRIARRPDVLIDVMHRCAEQQVAIVTLSDCIDSSTPIGAAVLEQLSQALEAITGTDDDELVTLETVTTAWTQVSVADSADVAPVPTAPGGGMS